MSYIEIRGLKKRFGDNVVLKITADSVTLTNATGRFVWKP